MKKPNENAEKVIIKPRPPRDSAVAPAPEVSVPEEEQAEAPVEGPAGGPAGGPAPHPAPGAEVQAEEEE